MRLTITAFCLVAAGTLGAGTLVVAAQQTSQGSQPPVPFTEEYLHDEANIAVGADVWHEQCRHCHGRSAYPGKAPKLRPAKYKPEFVYRRVTDGFRKMPSWKDVFTDEQRMAVTAYVLSPKFSP